MVPVEYARSICLMTLGLLLEPGREGRGQQKNSWIIYWRLADRILAFRLLWCSSACTVEDGLWWEIWYNSEAQQWMNWNERPDRNMYFPCFSKPDWLPPTVFEAWRPLPSALWSASHRGPHWLWGSSQCFLPDLHSAACSESHCSSQQREK